MTEQIKELLIDLPAPRNDESSIDGCGSSEAEGTLEDVRRADAKASAVAHPPLWSLPRNLGLYGW